MIRNCLIFHFYSRMYIPPVTQQIVLPGDTQRGYCAFPPPPHWKFLSPPKCGHMMSAAVPHISPLQLCEGDCETETPLWRDVTQLTCRLWTIEHLFTTLTFHHILCAQFLTLWWSNACINLAGFLWSYNLSKLACTDWVHHLAHANTTQRHANVSWSESIKVFHQKEGTLKDVFVRVLYFSSCLEKITAFLHFSTIIGLSCGVLCTW